MKEFRAIIFILFLIITSIGQAQVGINTTTPEGALDISSTTNGILLPRVALSSALDITTVVNPQGGALVEGTLVFNTGLGGLTPKGYYYWNNSAWTPIAAPSIQTYVGKAIITAGGTISITDVPFRPKNIKFTAYSNVDAFTLSNDNGGANNVNNIQNAFGFMRGYAQLFPSGTINQQVIYGGGSGASINDISRFASPLHCIGLRYSNNNGDSLGITSAILTSLDANGFTLNVDSFADPVVIIFEAYRN